MQDELRAKLKAWNNQCKDILSAKHPEDFTGKLLELPAFPQECIGMKCGAKNRSRQPCKIDQIYPNGRCKFHGGLSTGPKTIEGKRRSALNTGKTYDELLLQRNRWQ